MSSKPAPVHIIAASELRHQMRTPLNHIVGYSEILVEEFPSGPHRAGLDSMLAEARSMVGAVQQVLAGDAAATPEYAIAELSRRLENPLHDLLHRVGVLKGSMPAAAKPDLDRIAAAVETFRRTLEAGPLAEGAAPVHPMEKHAQVRPGSAAGRGRILVVDDDEMNRDMLSRQLERQNHDVATASDGLIALDMLRASRFDIVLLDLMMPGMNGFEVLESVKRDPALSGVAVILVSALDEMDSVVRSIEAGAEDYLFKPVNPTLLRARIQSTLDKLRAEENVRRKQRLESIGLLAAGIAHDFNNLLTGIIGHAQLLEYSLTDPGDKEAVESIVAAGERAADLTRQLLAYSGKAMFHMKPVDLAECIRETEALINASLSRRVTLRLNLNHAPAIFADENQIRQVLLNLILNAAEAIGPETDGAVAIETGGVTVENGARFDVGPDDVKTGRYAWFEVRDTGCGMDAATSAKMFEPFFTTKFLGRGLGLAAVAGIIRAHHGMLRVITAPGRGTIVRACFPAVEREKEEAQQVQSRSLVLVVDDELVVRQIVKVALERAGRTVLLAASGEEALELFRQFDSQIDLVLLDWKMPIMDGSGVLTRLREIRTDFRVIVSSGLGHAEAEAEFRDSAVSGYLQKPYRMSQLVEAVDKALQPLTNS